MPRNDGTIPEPYSQLWPSGTWEVERTPSLWHRLHPEIEAALRNRRYGQNGSFTFTQENRVALR
eukprot:10384646-Alexandrium_andersonii.AAC.1